MEPRKDEEKKTPQPRPEEKKPKRFRLIRLEERIAPTTGPTPDMSVWCGSIETNHNETLIRDKPRRAKGRKA
jgi:hypothetical protein